MRLIPLLAIAVLLTITACQEAEPAAPPGSYALDVEAMLEVMDERMSEPAAPMTETQASSAEDFKSKMLGMFKGVSAMLEVKADSTFQIPVMMNGVVRNTYSGAWTRSGNRISLQGEATTGPGMSSTGTLLADGIHFPNGFADIKVPVVFLRR